MALRIVKVGRVRDGLFRTTAVDVIGLDYDWWHSLAEADDQLEPGDGARRLAVLRACSGSWPG
jgi:hypothetical protein